VFRYTEGAFESFYKCGVKRVKRDFLDGLWTDSRRMGADQWKQTARRKLVEFEEQLHDAFEAGTTTYSGRSSWSFVNSAIYCFTVVTTIGNARISRSSSRLTGCRFGAGGVMCFCFANQPKLIPAAFYSVIAAFNRQTSIYRHPFPITPTTYNRRRGPIRYPDFNVKHNIGYE